MSNHEFDNKTIGVGIVFDGPQVAIYADHQFTLGVDADVARTIARRMLEMADLIDPPKKEEPPKGPAPAVEGGATAAIDSASPPRPGTSPRDPESSP